MSMTDPTAYTTAINAEMAASGPVKVALDYLGAGFGWPANAEQMGVVSVPVFSAYTAAGTTVGTMTTSGSNDTIASMTLADSTVTDKRLPKAWKSILTSNENVAIMIKQMADGLRAKALYDLLAGMATSTPTTSNTLTAGYMNFDGCTAVELAIAIRTVNGVASYNSGSYEGMIGLMHPTAWSNFVTGVSTLVNSAGMIDPLKPFHFLIPWVPVSDDSASYWGAASANCAYIIQTRGYGLKQAEAFSHYPAIPWPAGDGSHEITYHAPYVHGSLNVKLTGEIVNDAS